MFKYLLAPYVSCGFYHDELDIGFGSILISLKNKADQESFLKTAVYSKKPRTLKEIKNFIFNSTSSKNPDEIFNIFLANNLLIKESYYNPHDRFNRNYLYYNLSGADPRMVHEAIQDKHVVILGCGGIGNIIAVNLATSGIGKLTLIDDDSIELSNLTRQIMFTEDSLHQKKTKQLKKALLQRNSKLCVEIIDLAIISPVQLKLIPDNHLIVVSGDSPKICNYLNTFCFDKKIPFINIGYIQDIACWGPFIIPGQTACYDCFTQLNIANHKNELAQLVEKINCDYQAPSFGAINMLAASLATLDIIKYLGKFGKIQTINQRVGLWTNSLKIEQQHYKKLDTCYLCY